MSQGQRLSDQQVIQLEKHLFEKFTSIKGQLQQIQGTIDSLEGQWQGIARGAFDGKQEEINTSMVRLGNILAKFLEALSASRKIKDGSEDDVRAAVQSINVDLGVGTTAPSNLSKL
ncbi:MULTISPECIES: WXG100 family type VII secretion target [Streptomyces]|uniref:WXG100 family type VII secretion target n=1 Tax=Streptomyces achmelvichensis TaxID=3134111 RepID=A0ACC6Q3R1_9ACTN|nr:MULTISPECIES: WXG100 family type VII secretion target [unclassified Streptomyces]WNO71944.1 WXG100 family type VII secretion target [Streptomyces sp. AM8-1-1]WST40523.1 WXG100 family type VII secretion target [Streptomyces sp. NBC_01167]